MIPRMEPIIVIIDTKKRVEKILVLLPIMTRDNISLPYLSVPNGCAHEGIALALDKS
jgi:hypothetical protein